MRCPRTLRSYCTPCVRRIGGGIRRRHRQFPGP
jgi:hypothetical protein